VEVTAADALGKLVPYALIGAVGVVVA